MIPKHTLSCEEQLQQLQKEFDEFAYIVSHDLKAPTRALVNLSEWIEEDLGDDLPEDAGKNLALLRNRANRMEKMITALLQYTRIARTDLDLEEVNVATMLQNLQTRLATDKIIHLELPSSLPVFITYKEKLNTVFLELLQNAVFFSSNQVVHLKIVCSQVDNFYEFAVTDDSGGIPQETLPKIFKLFYTAAPKDKLETIGAGLALVKKIISFTGGHITATSAGKETTMCFTWPVVLNQV